MHHILHPINKETDEIQYHTALQLIRCRDDRIRTCGPYVPNVVRYRAALHPEKGNLNFKFKAFIIFYIQALANDL
jgi:hypothetical protein